MPGVGVRAARLRRRPRGLGTLKRDARAILAAGQRAIEPGKLVRDALGRARGGAIRVGRSLVPAGRVLVVAVGKAAAGMAAAARAVLGPRWTRGIVISNAPVSWPRSDAGTRVFVAGHPTPDGRGVRAGRAVIRLLRDAKEGDLVLLLLSGGASALMPAPRRGVSLSAKRRITEALLARGATIEELNAVRGRLSLLKAGGFARLASPARVATVAISDVPGDDPAVIGSGPGVVVAESARSLAALRRAARLLRGVRVPEVARRLLSKRATTDPCPKHAPLFVLAASAVTFLIAASLEARRRGYRATTFPGGLRGEARRMSKRLVETFERAAGRTGRAHLWSGETTVRVRGRGIGGRNLELALAAVPLLVRGRRPVVLAALATDGLDGPSGAAGALVGPDTALSLRSAGISVRRALRENDSFTALRAVGATRITGPSGSNVSDIALILG